MALDRTRMGFLYEQCNKLIKEAEDPSKVCVQISAADMCLLLNQVLAIRLDEIEEEKQIVEPAKKALSLAEQAVLTVIRAEKRCNDEDLISSYRDREAAFLDIPELTDGGISSRRRALVLLGLVRDSGKRKNTSSGRESIIWEINP